ncbi:hypothetical protein [Paraflavitalea speifideaquila]|uniref:hypothetical protein n=1 Tax=Paraflavitalea speifideaquila TaxID=3076558 RepID=UPI0028F0F8FF|nr:hypothetical protein [Paraflavitalea speifideiaquila]
MDSLAYKPKILETLKNVQKLSFAEKKEAILDEGKINAFLDKVLEFKKAFAEKTNKLNSLIEIIEQITWFTDVDSESLMKINDLISAIRDLRSTLLRQYVSLDVIRVKGIAKVEIKNFKSTIDDLRDVASDLESRFFFLPNIPGFQETTKELSLV